MTQRTGSSKPFRNFYEIFVKLGDSEEDVKDMSAQQSFLEEKCAYLILKAEFNGLFLP